MHIFEGVFEEFMKPGKPRCQIALSCFQSFRPKRQFGLQRLADAIKLLLLFELPILFEGQFHPQCHNLRIVIAEARPKPEKAALPDGRCRHQSPPCRSRSLQACHGNTDHRDRC